MDPLTTAFTNLVDEYSLLGNVVTSSAQSRRTMAMEAVTAAIFNDLDTELDPEGRDDLNEDAVEACFGFCLYASELLTLAMLDFHELVGRRPVQSEGFRDRLLRLLADIWAVSKKELLEGEE